MERRGNFAGVVQGTGFCQLFLFALQAALLTNQFSAFAKEDRPGDDRGQNQANHHHLHHDVSMLIHTPDGKVRLHQLIPHSVAPGQKSQNCR